MIIWLIFYIPLAIFCLALVTFVVSKLMHKSLVSGVSECILWWMTISVVLPFRAKKLGVFSRYLPGCVLTLLSPAGFVTYFIIYAVATNNDPMPYDKLQFTSPKEIMGITELPDFPIYEYQTNVHDGFDDYTCIKYTFKYEKQVDWLWGYLERTVSSENNIYWKKDSLTSNEDIHFFGSTSAYILERGWDSLYVKRPRNIDISDAQVRIVIGRKGFTVSSNVCWTGNLDRYAAADSLEKLTGIKFPPYRFVNKHFDDNFQDYSCDATIRMDNKPSKAMIESIENAASWSKCTDGTYSFRLDNQKGFVESVNVNPDSRYATITYGTY